MVADTIDNPGLASEVKSSTRRCLGTNGVLGDGKCRFDPTDEAVAKESCDEEEGDPLSARTCLVLTGAFLSTGFRGEKSDKSASTKISSVKLRSINSLLAVSRWVFAFVCTGFISGSLGDSDTFLAFFVKTAERRSKYEISSTNISLCSPSVLSGLLGPEMPLLILIGGALAVLSVTFSLSFGTVVAVGFAMTLSRDVVVVVNLCLSNGLVELFKRLDVLLKDPSGMVICCPLSRVDGRPM